MTEHEMIELADKAGFFVKDNEAYSPSVQEDHELTPCLKAFAKLVAEKEREACARMCDEFFKGNKNINYSDTIAICIRARAKA
jgi:hypothetical protein